VDGPLTIAVAASSEARKLEIFVGLADTSRIWHSSGATDACFSLGLGYDADGRIESGDLSYSFGSDSNSTQVAYVYDGQMRLASATVTGDAQGNESVGQYDANGNIWQLTQDGVESRISGRRFPA